MPVHKQKARTLRLAVILILLTKGLMGIGQDLNPQTRNAGQFPTVVFNCSRSGAAPPFYSIAVDSTGSATYESLPNSGAPYTMEFLASDTTRTQIFAMIESLKFLKGSNKTSIWPQPTCCRYILGLRRIIQWQRNSCLTSYGN